MDFPVFPLTADSPAPGAQHDSIEEAIEEADADGTRSILDMERVAEEADYGAVAPMPREVLQDLFGTEQPTREMVEGSEELYDALERGQGVYVVVYDEGGRPSEIFFAGYSYD